MSQLLIDSEPLQVLPRLAQTIGLNEAIFLQQLHYWLQKSNHEHDERRWVYNTFEDWHRQFPFWSLKTMQRIAGRLVKDGVLIVRQFKKKDWDRTNWYSIDYKALEAKTGDSVRLSVAKRSSCRSRSSQPVDLITKVSEITTENTTEIATAAPSKTPVPPEIQLIRELTRRYPPKELWPRIILTVGPNPAEHRLTQCWEEWRLRGFKPTNFAWLTEWYVKGIPPPNGHYLPTQAEMNRGGTGKLVI